MPRGINQQETSSRVDKDHIVSCRTETSVPRLQPGEALRKLHIAKIHNDSAVFGEQHFSQQEVFPQTEYKTQPGARED